MKAIGISLAVLTMSVLFPGTARGAQEIGLESAIDFALRQNPKLRLTELSLESSRLSLGSARTTFSTKVTPAGEVSEYDKGDTYAAGAKLSRKTTVGTTMELEGEVTRQRYAGTEDYHRGNVEIEIRQPLLRQFGVLVNREPVTEAESRLTAARRELELRKTDLVVDVVDTYERLLRLAEQERFDLENLERLDKLQRLTRVREKQGRATRVDLLRVELQYSEAQAALNATRERLGSVRAEFADLLGFDPEREFRALPTEIPRVDVPDIEEAVRIAFANRLDYAQVLQDCVDAARGRRIARRNLLPDLNLITRYEQYGEGEAFSDGTSLDEDSWFVGLSVDTELFRRKDRLNLKQAELNEVTAHQTVRILESGLRRQVRQALLAYNRTHADILFAERNYGLAESRAKLARKRYEMGKGDNFSVTDAESALQVAQSKMLAAQAEAVLASYKLMRTLGTLLEYPEDLKPGALDVDREWIGGLGAADPDEATTAMAYPGEPEEGMVGE